MTLKKFIAIAGDKVRLRDFRAADIATFVAYRNDPAVARYQSWTDYSAAQGADFFAQQQSLEFGQPGSWYQIAIADVNSDGLLGDRLLGDCVIHFLADDDQQVEIGFTLAAEHQGHGYASEAIGLLLQVIFQQLNKHRVFAQTDVLNEGSIRLLEKLQFRREAHFVDNIWFKGAWGSEFIYALLRREYLV